MPLIQGQLRTRGARTKPSLCQPALLLSKNSTRNIHAPAPTVTKRSGSVLRPDGPSAPAPGGSQASCCLLGQQRAFRKSELMQVILGADSDSPRLHSWNVTVSIVQDSLCWLTTNEPIHPQGAVSGAHGGTASALQIRSSTPSAKNSTLIHHHPPRPRQTHRAAIRTSLLAAPYVHNAAASLAAWRRHTSTAAQATSIRFATRDDNDDECTCAAAR